MAFETLDILSEAEIDNLFSGTEETQENNEETPNENNSEQKETQETTEVDVEKLFEPEGVGSENDNKEKGDSSSNNDGSSPYIYSSIAKALKEEAILPDLDDEVISKIAKPEDFAEAIEKQIQAKFDERQKRIDEALNNGIEPSVIQNYERIINYLSNVDDKQLDGETEQAENLRKQLIYQDYINRGFSKERATREVERAIKNGTDIEDAKEALTSNKDFYNKQYQQEIDKAKAQEEANIAERNKQAEKLKKSILEDKKLFGDLELDKSTRQKILDNIAKPIYKDPETGDLFTAIQKYEKENRSEFLTKVGIIYTLTDGFKNLDGLVKSKVKKEINKGLKDLEQTLNNTARTSDGNLNFMSGITDTESSFKGFTLDV